MMKKADYLILLFSGLFLLGIAMVFQKVPGYMDAEYYYSNGIRLFEGYGFTEEIIWNYLSDPQGLPTPSHAYWMPLPSILAAGGMLLCGENSYTCARLPFLLLGSFLSPLTALASWRFNKNRVQALFSGVLALFSGFYLVYITAVETFGLYLFFGVLFLLLSGEILRSQQQNQKIPVRYLFLGIICAGFYLSRADGVLWLLAAGLVLVLDSFRGYSKVLFTKKTLLQFFKRGLIFSSGFLLPVIPWIIRTYMTFGTLTAPGSGYMFYLTEYDQLFSFPPESLNITNWLASGWSNIFNALFVAAKNNLQTFLAVQGSIFLFPFVIAGIWKQRKKDIVRVMCFAWILIFSVMTIIFPHAGYRGGFLHSGSSVQAFFWVMIPSGFDSIIRFFAEKRKWHLPQAEKIFRIGMITLSILFTGFIYFQKVIITENDVPVWEKGANHYALIAENLDNLFPDSEKIVMVNDPPGFYLASGRSAIVIPYGSLDTLFSAAEKFNAGILVLEKNHVDGLDQLYSTPDMSSRLRLAAEFDDNYIFEIIK